MNISSHKKWSFLQYINVTFFRGWHRRLSPLRKHCRLRRSGGWQCFSRGNSLPCHSLKNVILNVQFSETNSTIVGLEITAMWHCHVTFQIFTRLIDQSNLWRLTWVIIICFIICTFYSQLSQRYLIQKPDFLNVPRHLLEGMPFTMSIAYFTYMVV